MNIFKQFLAIATALLLTLQPITAFAAPISIDMRWAKQSAVMVHINFMMLDETGMLITKKYGGSGTAVHTDGKMTRILTAGHVCDVTRVGGIFPHAVVYDTSRNVYPGGIVAIDQQEDLCLIDVVGSIRSLDVALQVPESGTKCAMIGAPGRFGIAGQAWPTHDEVILNEKTHAPLGQNTWEVTADIVGGWSGAGIVCGSRLVGVVYAMDTKISELAYMTGADYIRLFLKEHNAHKDWRKK